MQSKLWTIIILREDSKIDLFFHAKHPLDIFPDPPPPSPKHPSTKLDFFKVATNLENMENVENSGNLKYCQNLRENSGKFENENM